MPVFVAGSDETSSHNRQGEFFYGGFVAPQRDWDEFFAPAWEERVLKTSPTMEFMHVSDIKREKWCLENNLTGLDVERKLDEAFRVIRGSIRTICVSCGLRCMS